MGANRSTGNIPLHQSIDWRDIQRDPPNSSIESIDWHLQSID
ncbi:unnamed protein product [Rhodiola kirilowii]